MTTATLGLPGQTVAVELERHASRAAFLAGSIPSARDALLFANVLLNAQGSLARQLAGLTGLRGRISDDAQLLATLSRPLLEKVERHGRRVLAMIAQERLDEENSVAEERLVSFWSDDASARDDYVTRA